MAGSSTAFLGWGGSRQLADAIHLQGDGSIEPSSFLADRLLHLFGWGLLSATTVQWLADGAKLDGLSNAKVDRIAGIGTNGRHGGNCRRDLLRSCCADSKIAKPLTVHVPMYSKLRTIEMGQIDMLPPTMLIESIYRHYNAAFQSIFVGMGPRNFWDSVDPEDPKLLAFGRSSFGGCLAGSHDSDCIAW